MMSLRLPRAGMIRGYLQSHSAVKIGITAIQGEEFDSHMSRLVSRRVDLLSALNVARCETIEGQADIARTSQIGRSWPTAFIEPA